MLLQSFRRRVSSDLLSLRSVSPTWTLCLVSIALEFTPILFTLLQFSSLLLTSSTKAPPKASLSTLLLCPDGAQGKRSAKLELPAVDLLNEKKLPTFSRISHFRTSRYRSFSATRGLIKSSYLTVRVLQYSVFRLNHRKNLNPILSQEPRRDWTASKRVNSLRSTTRGDPVQADLTHFWLRLEYSAIHSAKPFEIAK